MTDRRNNLFKRRPRSTPQQNCCLGEAHSPLSRADRRKRPPLQEKASQHPRSSSTPAARRLVQRHHGQRCSGDHLVAQAARRRQDAVPCIHSSPGSDESHEVRVRRRVQGDELLEQLDAGHHAAGGRRAVRVSRRHARACRIGTGMRSGRQAVRSSATTPRRRGRQRRRAARGHGGRWASPVWRHATRTPR
jgi:hypothetical protein